MINPNQCLRWLFNAVPKQLFQEICIKSKILSTCAYTFSKIAMIWRDLMWPRKSPKINLHLQVSLAQDITLGGISALR